MNKYKELFPFLPLPPAAVEIAFRTLKIPFYTDTPFDAYGFVPALTPLWATDSPSYTGYWKHWFAPQRQPTFVEVYVRDDYRAIEIARNFMQLMQRVLLIAITIEGIVTPDVQNFARQAGINPTQLTEIAGLAEASGDDDASLISLPAFAPDPPLSCFPEDGRGYPGDFPHDAMMLTPQNVRSICTFEASEWLYHQIAALPFAPPWFTSETQAPVFNRLLQQEDYAGAWMSLNSTGWQFPQAKDAMRRLAERVDVPGFGLLAEAWISEPHGATPVTTDTTSY